MITDKSPLNKAAAAMGIRKALIQYGKFFDQTKNRKAKIENNLDEKLKAKNPDDIVKTAEKKVGEKFEYNLLKNNCEHFANWCHYGDEGKMSLQIEVSTKNC